MEENQKEAFRIQCS